MPQRLLSLTTCLPPDTPTRGQKEKISHGGHGVHGVFKWILQGVLLNDRFQDCAERKLRESRNLERPADARTVSSLDFPVAGEQRRALSVRSL